MNIKIIGKFVSLSVLLLAVMSSFGLNAQGVIASPKKSNKPSTQSHASSKKSTSRNNVSISEPDGYINGHGYVDLGLPSGLKWATCNVGTNKLYQYGGLYRFGDPTGKLYDNEDFLPDDNIIGTNNDVATKLWGSDWRTPSIEDAKELLENCILTDTICNNVRGTKVIGPSSNSIFLPYAGIMYNYGRSQAGSIGSYQLGECWKQINQFTHKPWAQSYELSLFVDVFEPKIIYYGTPTWGLPVRAVSNK